MPPLVRGNLSIRIEIGIAVGIVFDPGPDSDFDPDEKNGEIYATTQTCHAADTGWMGL